MIKPTPLQTNTIIQERFQIESVLGQGGFGIVYLAFDLLRKDKVVVKELAPVGITRGENGILNLDELGFSAAHRLRSRFIDEAKVLGKLNLPCVPKIRSLICEYGTAFFVTEYFPAARTLADQVKTLGPLDEQLAFSITEDLAETLESIHAKGLLHRDIKPSNVLVRPKQGPLLIDFGAAREWHTDRTDSQTAIFTPGYAPLEMFSELGVRGPATDVYGLTATLFFMLTGTPPPSAADRMNGIPLPSILDLRPITRSSICQAITSGLALRSEDRPNTMAEFLEILRNGLPQAHPVTLGELDHQATRLAKLKPYKKQCPVCQEVMTEPKPLGKNVCPVCRQGHIKARVLNTKACPICRTGVLRCLDNTSHPRICPVCKVHTFKEHKHGFISKTIECKCKGCGTVIGSSGDVWTLVDDPGDPDRIGETHFWDEWREISGRTESVMSCDTCEGIFDILVDGRWKQVFPVPTGVDYSCLYPDEWARVAANLDPGAGTHFCNCCEADYYIDDTSFTLLGATEDPFGFNERFQGRHLLPEQSRWVGNGKISPHPGPTCTACGTEFDWVESDWRLVRTNLKQIKSLIDEVHHPADWHRLAQNLPISADEPEFFKNLDLSVQAEYRTGQLDLDAKGTLWRGSANLTSESKDEDSVLTVNPKELVFGPLLRKLKIKVREIEQVHWSGDTLLVTTQKQDSYQFTLDPIELTAHLDSGDRTIILSAEDLGTLIQWCMENAPADSEEELSV